MSEPFVAPAAIQMQQEFDAATAEIARLIARGRRARTDSAA
ncbi:hypothetical protein ABZ912_38290 [Nonomuraea angiospora]